MKPSKEDLIVLIRHQVEKLTYVTKEQNSLRLGYLKDQAYRLIELIDAMPEPERSNTSGMYSE